MSEHRPCCPMGPRGLGPLTDTMKPVLETVIGGPGQPAWGTAELPRVTRWCLGGKPPADPCPSRAQDSSSVTPWDKYKARCANEEMEPHLQRWR